MRTQTICERRSYAKDVYPALRVMRRRTRPLIRNVEWRAAAQRYAHFSAYGTSIQNPRSR